MRNGVSLIRAAIATRSTWLSVFDWARAVEGDRKCMRSAWAEFQIVDDGIESSAILSRFYGHRLKRSCGIGEEGG